MRWIPVVLSLAIASVAGAEAPPPQPQPPQPQPPQPQPQVQVAPAVPPVAGALYRFTLRDGRVVDAYWTGGDPSNYYIQNSAGSYWLPRADVTAAMPLGAAPPMAPQQPVYQPPQQPMYQPPPRDPNFGKAENVPEDPKHASHEGAIIFGSTYSITALIALGRLKDDEDAVWGFIPIAGPIIWTSTDSDEFGKDGYDWLAILDTSLQVLGAWRWIDGATKPAPKRPGVSIVPVSRPGYGGFAVGGSF